jgi:hypothetical protein
MTGHRLAKTTGPAPPKSPEERRQCGRSGLQPDRFKPVSEHRTVETIAAGQRVQPVCSH